MTCRRERRVQTKPDKMRRACHPCACFPLQGGFWSGRAWHHPPGQLRNLPTIPTPLWNVVSTQPLSWVLIINGLKLETQSNVSRKKGKAVGAGRVLPVVARPLEAAQLSMGAQDFQLEERATSLGSIQTQRFFIDAFSPIEEGGSMINFQESYNLLNM
jgi:hypothetical protein